MYSTCLFCHKPLGANEIIEHFPVGRKLAFDSDKGRLWVVCVRCGKWNLTPIEERWEAIEDCERRFRGARLRYSTDNVGLARLREGLDLVRIGKPLLPEIAAWRYTRTLKARSERYWGLCGSGSALGLVALAAAGPMWGSVALIASQLFGLAPAFYPIWKQRWATATRVPLPDGSAIAITGNQAFASRVISVGPDHWCLSIPYKVERHESAGDKHGMSLRELDAHVRKLKREAKSREDLNEKLASMWKLRGAWQRQLLRHGSVDRIGLQHPEWRFATLEGEQAIRAAGLILPHVNFEGGSAKHVGEAVRLLEDSEGTAGCFLGAARLVRAGAGPELDFAMLRALPPAVRLSLEISSQEDRERAFLENRLQELEREWRDAEEIAAIADNMFLPESVKALWKIRGQTTQSPN